MKAVRIFLLQNDLTFQKVADHLGISKSYAHEVISGSKKALHIRQRLIDELGFPADLVGWPEERANKKAA